MANKYSDILTLTANGKNQMGLSNTIKRDYGIPLDFSSVQENYAKAVEYAATSTLAYVGQPISVGDKLYIITEASQGKYPLEVAEGETQYDVYLTEVGSATEGDSKTIELKDGILSLYGIDGKDSGTYVPTLVNGVLTWNKPDTTTVDGLAAAVEGLEDRAEALESIVGKAAEGEAEATGLVKAVADNAAAIADITKAETGAIAVAISAEASARGEAIKAVTDSIGTVAEGKTVVEMITDAEAAAKAAIPTDNASFTNGAGYQTASDVSSAITAAIAGKANSADVYTKTEVDGKIEGLENTIAGITHFTTKVVSSTAEVTEIGVLYLIKDESVTGTDKYNEYLFIEGLGAVLIGDTTTNLSDYVTNSALATELAKYTTTEGLATVLAPYAKSETVAADLAKKVDAETYAADKATFALEESVASRLAGKAAVGDSYTKSEEDALLATKANAETTTAALATKVETAQIRHTSEGVGEGVTKDGTALTITVDAYRKSEVYTKSETDAAITAKINSVTGGESAADVKLALEDYRDALNSEMWGADAANWTTRTTDEDGKTIVTYTPQYGSTSRIDTLESDVATLKTNVEKAQTDATNAGTAVETLKTTTVADNTRRIGVVEGQISGEGGLSARIGSLEAANSAHATEYANLKAKVDTAVDTTIPALTARVADNEAAITTINNTLNGIEGTEGLIATVTKKANAADVYTKAEIDATVGTINTEIGKKADAATTYSKTEVDTAISTAIGNIDNTAITNNAADIAVLVGTDKGEDGRANKSIRDIAADEINTLIKAADPEGGKTIENINNLIAYVDENAGEIAELITATGANTAKLADITGTVGATIDAKIEAAKYTLEVATSDKLGGIKSATGDNKVTVAEDGIASVGSVNVNSLTQTIGDILILNGGTASD